MTNPLAELLADLDAVFKQSGSRWYLFVASREDIVSMKILAGREKDLADALAIVSAQRDKLDRPRIQSVLAMLEEALDRRDLLRILDDLIRRAERL